MAYAKGKHAYGICDISGFRYKLNTMKKTWNGLLVGPDMFDPKHPQLDPTHHRTDPEALRDPRPAQVAPTTGYGIVKTENTKDVNGVTGLSMNINHNDPIGSSFDLQTLEASLGNVTIVT